jgi:hypothetical protein
MTGFSAEQVKDIALARSSARENAAQDYLWVTRDRVELHLTKHLAHLTTRNAWHAPGALFLTLLITVVTTDPKARFGLTADYWGALFILSTIGAGFWFLWSAIRAVAAAKHSMADLLDSLFRTRESDPHPDPPQATGEST